MWEKKLEMLCLLQHLLKPARRKSLPNNYYNIDFCRFRIISLVSVNEDETFLRRTSDVKDLDARILYRACVNSGWLMTFGKESDVTVASTE